MATKRKKIELSPLENTLALADNRQYLRDMPDESVDFIVTSPPYFNAKPEYATYLDSYDYFVLNLQAVFTQCLRVLKEGRFIAVNISPVIIPRKSRQHQSSRLPLMFRLNSIMEGLGFDFMEDIIWVKSTGNGWATGRNRSFSKHRTPLAYKPNVITEYILVYRKHTDRLIDWNIRKHPDQEAVEESKVVGDYEETNVWHIPSRSSKHHPAVYPHELVERLVRYYSFTGDVVLDPYAGIGTTAEACLDLNRRFVMIEQKPEYFEHMVKALTEKGSDAKIDKHPSVAELD